MFEVVSHYVILSKLPMFEVGGKFYLWVYNLLVGHTVGVQVAGYRNNSKVVTGHEDMGWVQCSF